MSDPILSSMYAVDYTAYTTAELAKLWNVSPSTIARWAAAGRLIGTKTGRGWLFSPAAATAFLQAPKARATARLESRVAEIAIERGFPTIAALAQATGIHQRTIARYWQRLPRYIHSTTLGQICKTLQAQLGDLLILVKE